MDYAEANAILDHCNHEPKDCELSSGQRVCCTCWNAHIYAWRDARRAQMAAQPRCDVPKCGRRGAMRAMGVLLCKAHFTRANRAYLRRMAANPVGLFLAVTYPPEQFIAMAEE